MHKLLLVVCCLCCFWGCSNQDKSTVLTVQASFLPQSELLEQIRADLLEEGFQLRILVVDDYNTPNRALSEGEIDANFFQHKPFLQEQIEQFSYDIVPLTEVHIEPMGIYTKRDSKQILKEGIITIPNDPTNESRALLLLEQSGFIRMEKKEGLLSLWDIKENPLNLQFKEIDAALLGHTLDEVDAAVIPTNYALIADLSPLKDAIFLEDSSSLYANIIAVQKEQLHSPKLQALKKVLSSQKLRDYIEETYKGAIIPATPPQ